MSGWQTMAIMGFAVGLTCGTGVLPAMAVSEGVGSATFTPLLAQDTAGNPRGVASDAAPAMPATPQPAAALVVTLDEAVRRALSANLAIRAKEYELRSVQANEITAGLIPNPTLSTGVSNAQGTSQWSVDISQTFELGGKRQRRLDSARASSEVAARSADDLKRLTILQVKQAYVAIIVAKAQAEQTQANLKELDAQLRLQALRARTGDLSDLDLLRVEQQRFQFESDAADAEQNLRVAKVNFRVAVGTDQLPDNFDVLGTFDLRDVTASRADLYALAEQNRPDVRLAALDVRRAEADNRLAQANGVPDLIPSIGYGWTSDRGDAVFNAPHDVTSGGNILGLAINVPIFNRNQGEIERTARDAQRVGVVRDAAVIQARSDVDITLAVLGSARAKYLVLRDTYFPKAKAIRDRTELAYRQGSASLLDFLDAERQFRTIAFAFITAKGNYDSALYQLEAAVGGPVK